MGIKIAVDQASGEVQTTDHSVDQDGVAQHSEHVMTDSKFYTGQKGPACQVGFGAGLTIPTYQFANARPYVSLTLPADFDQLDEAYKFANDWVDTRLQEIHEVVKKSI